jgi:PAS domain S-box-containing protein
MKQTDLPTWKTRAQWHLLWAVLLFLGTLLGGILYYDYSRIEKDAEASLSFRSAAGAADLERRLESLNTALNGIRASSPFFKTDKRGLEIANRQLKALSNSLEGVRTLALFDATGTMIASNRPEIVGQNFADRAYFKLPKAERNPGRLYVSAPIKTILGVYSVILTKSIVGADGEFSGIVTATLDPEDFKSTLEGAREVPDAFAGIVHGNGQVFLFAPASVALPTSEFALMQTFYADHKKSAQPTSVKTGLSPYTNAIRMVAMTTVQTTSLAMDQPLIVVVSRDVAQIFDQWHKQAILATGILLGLTLLSTLSLRFYQRRLRNLEQTVQIQALGRQQAEQKVRDSAQLMQSFLDHLPGMAYVKDSDCRVLMANRGFQMIGLDPALMIGKTNLEMLPEPFGEKVTADDQRVLANGKIELMQEELAGRSFETSKFVIDDESGQRLLGGITLDVTARQRHVRLTQALLEVNEIGSLWSEKDFLTRGLELAERLTNSGIGFLHFVNDDQETLELITWTSNALKGCTAVHDAHYPISQAGIWADCFRQKRPVVFNDYAACTHKQGLPVGHAPLQRLISVPVIESGAVRLMLGVGNKPIDYDDFDLEAVQLIGNDLWRIARRNRAERQLQQQLVELGALNTKLAETQGQLLQSEKLSAIGQLAAGIAHEINNPVGFVYSNLTTLTEYVDDLLDIDSAYSEVEDHLQSVAPQLLERVRALKSACDHPFVVTDLRHLLRESGEGLERVKTIVQDLKGFSRTGDTSWEWSDLQRGLDSTLNIVRNEIKYKADIVRELATLPPVRCIPAQINQVFMNLLVNAAQAIEERGTITLRCGVDGDSVWISVQDDGCGIEPDKLSRIFDPFYTSKPVGKGTGLGLTLVWGIVQRHQGSINVQSTVGHGACFALRLPINGPINVPNLESPGPP